MVNNETPEKVMANSVGLQLQQAREKVGLSVSDIADAQHLRPAVIQDIESGDYSRINSELFLKGYVRAYAKHVGLDADRVIAELDRELEPLRLQKEQEHEANPLVDIERKRCRKRRVARVLFALVVVALAAYLVLTFVVPQGLLNDQQVSEPGDASPAGQAKTPVINDSEEPVLSDSVNAATEVDSQVPADTAEPSDGSVQPVAPVALATDTVSVTEAGAEPVAGEAAVQISEGSRETDGALESQPSEVVPALVPAPEPLVQDPAEPVVVAESASLQINFIDDCWVQVSDAAGNRLVNSLQRSGDRVDVSGAAPLKVVIGAVDAVGSIFFEGEPVDMSGYRVVNNRSEFSLTI